MVDNRARRLDRFHALASATRRAIFEQLSRGEQTVGEVAEPFDISISAVSKHLHVLERARLVERRRVGRTTRCRVRGDVLNDAANLLDHYRAYWEKQVDALDQFLQARRKSEP